MHFRVGAYPALNRTGRYRFASSASRLLLLILAAALALTGCATKANLSPTSRIVLFCNPVGHAVDPALLGMALGVAAYGGVGVWPRQAARRCRTRRRRPSRRSDGRPVRRGRVTSPICSEST